MKVKIVEAILNEANDPEMAGAGYHLRIRTNSGMEYLEAFEGIRMDCLYRDCDGGGGPGLFIPCDAIELIEVVWLT